MTIDISSLVNITGTNLYGSSTTNTNTGTSSTDFASVLLNALSGKSTKTDKNPLYTALTSATNTDLYTQSTSSSYTDYLSNYMGSSSSIEGYLSNYTNDRTSSEQISDSLIASFQGQMLNTLLAAKTKLADNATAYEARVGDDASEATKLRLEQMQQNVSILDQFITQKKSENNLLDTMNTNSSLTQYLLDNKQSSLL